MTSRAMLVAAVFAGCGCGGPAPIELRPILELSAFRPPSLVVFRTSRGDLLVGRRDDRISTFAVLGPAPRAEEEVLFTAPDGFVPYNLILIDRGDHDDLLIPMHPHRDSCAEQLWRIDGSTLTASLVIAYDMAAEPCSRVSELPGYALVLGESAVTGVILVGRDNSADPTHLVSVDALDALAAEPCRSVDCLRRLGPSGIGRALQQGSPVAFERHDGLRLYGTRTEVEGHAHPTALASFDCDASLSCTHVEDIAPVDWFSLEPAQVGFGPEPVAVSLVSTAGPVFTITAEGVERRESTPSATRAQVVRTREHGLSRFIVRSTDRVRYRYELDRYGSADAPEATWSFGGWGAEDQYGVLIAASSTADADLTIYSEEVEGDRARIYRLPVQRSY